jgi:hypothetical protein
MLYPSKVMRHFPNQELQKLPLITEKVEEDKENDVECEDLTGKNGSNMLSYKEILPYSAYKSKVREIFNPLYGGNLSKEGGGEEEWGKLKEKTELNFEAQQISSCLELPLKIVSK